MNDNGTAKIVEESNYYPFGLKHKGYNNVVDPIAKKYKYGYNGKEEQDDLGLDWIDYGARNYDPSLGRWFNVDPMSDEREWLSPFQYVQNNPVFKIDPDGALDGDYYDKEGNYLGDDGKDDNKVYTVEGTSKFNVNDFKEGGKYDGNEEGFNQDNGEGYSVTYEGDVKEVRMTFTGEANKDNPKQADGKLNVIQVLDNGKEFTRLSVNAVGGPWGNGSPENGNYNVNTLLNRGKTGWYNKGMTKEGIGFSLNVDPKFKTGRSLLRIHPDGGRFFGTQGCIGLTCGKTGLVEFKSVSAQALKGQKNIPLNINIKGNPNNNGYGKKVRSNGE